MTSLRSSVGGIDLSCCVYNASGPRCGTVDALLKIANSKAGAVLSKSATLLPQDGNTLPRYKEIDLGPNCPGSINSEGLPNKGIEYYLKDDAVQAATGNNKPYILSISGKTLDDNMVMLKRACEVKGVTAIELNLACPNIKGKPVIAYDFVQMDDILQTIERAGYFKMKNIGIKLAPYFDMSHFQQAAKVLNKYPIKFVVCTNTIGNGLIIDAEAEQPLIAPNGGHGGLAGGYIKQVALANVRQMRIHLRKDIDVVGVGGVRSGIDAFELILCGAVAVQVATCHSTEGAACFGRIAAELAKIMETKNYTKIADFCGKLRDFDKSRARSMRKQGKQASDVIPETTSGQASWLFPVMLVLTNIATLLAWLYPELLGLPKDFQSQVLQWLNLDLTNSS